MYHRPKLGRVCVDCGMVVSSSAFLSLFCGFVSAPQAELANGEACCTAMREFITWR
jgi:hypothetical protein